MTTERASLIINTCRDDACTRILELFGRKFVYRNRENLRALLTTMNFRPARLMGSGNIYDFEIYERAESRDAPGRPGTPRVGELLVDAAAPFCQDDAILAESNNQFRLSLVGSSTCRGAKANAYNCIICQQGGGRYVSGATPRHG